MQSKAFLLISAHTLSIGCHGVLELCLVILSDVTEFWLSGAASGVVGFPTIFACLKGIFLLYSLQLIYSDLEASFEIFLFSVSHFIFNFTQSSVIPQAKENAAFYILFSLASGTLTKVPQMQEEKSLQTGRPLKHFPPSTSVALVIAILLAFKLFSPPLSLSVSVCGVCMPACACVG